MSLVTRHYVRTMARYNAWQNRGLRAALQAMPEAEIRRDRGAFFGSIFGTANHLLWGDMLWMSRFDGGEVPSAGPGKPPPGIKDSVGLCPDLVTWETLRYRTDGRINAWARALRDVDLIGDLTWFSGAAGREVSKPLALCIVHFFNHQTHHRGQIHAMLTAAGQRPGDTDLFLMPDPEGRGT